nr:C-type lectin domain-containing type 1 protein 3 [Arenicola marina]
MNQPAVFACISLLVMPCLILAEVLNPTALTFQRTTYVRHPGVTSLIGDVIARKMASSAIDCARSCAKDISCQAFNSKATSGGVDCSTLTARARYPSNFVTGVNIDYYDELHEDACADGWIRNNDSCYKAFPLERQWLDASLACWASGAHLMTLRDGNEQTFLQQDLGPNHVVKVALPFLQVWLGGAYSDTWRWNTTGDPIPPDPTLWARGPSNAVGDCLALSTGPLHSMLILDYNCFLARPYICQYNLDDRN